MAAIVSEVIELSLAGAWILSEKDGQKRLDTPPWPIGSTDFLAANGDWGK